MLPPGLASELPTMVCVRVATLPASLVLVVMNREVVGVQIDVAVFEVSVAGDVVMTVGGLVGIGGKTAVPPLLAPLAAVLPANELPSRVLLVGRLLTGPLLAMLFDTDSLGVGRRLLAETLGSPTRDVDVEVGGSVLLAPGVAPLTGAGLMGESVELGLGLSAGDTGDGFEEGPLLGEGEGG